MNTLTIPVKQHDYLHYECQYPRQPADDGSVDKHSLAIIRNAFQSIIDDIDELGYMLMWHRDNNDEKIGLHIKCAIYRATERYVIANIEELEKESSARSPRARRVASP